MITLDDIHREQQSWAEGLVAVSKSYYDGGDYMALAKDFIHRHYAYDEGKVLFKPTRASAKQFRPEFEDALSYFVAHNEVDEVWQKIRKEMLKNKLVQQLCYFVQQIVDLSIELY